MLTRFALELTFNAADQGTRVAMDLEATRGRIREYGKREVQRAGSLEEAVNRLVDTQKQLTEAQYRNSAVAQEHHNCTAQLKYTQGQVAHYRKCCKQANKEVPSMLETIKLQKQEIIELKEQIEMLNRLLDACQLVDDLLED